jgi:neutral ceramidase
MLRKIVRASLYFLAALLILVAVAIGPVDRTPAKEIAGYDSTLQQIRRTKIQAPRAGDQFEVGFSAVNMTPSSPLSTAGYGKRKGAAYETVHDSIYVRTMVLRSGDSKVAIVSADLLIVPPTVTQILPEKLAGTGFDLDNTFLTATHSHNSIGHWSEGAMHLIYGKYEDSIVQFIADKIVRSITLAEANAIPSVLRHGAVAVPEAVQNRVFDDGPEDPWLRAIEVQRSDSSKAVLVTFAAHATCIMGKTLALSRDYPGTLVDSLEANGYDFAMFSAGAVGSHKGTAPFDDWECMSWMASRLSDAFLESRRELKVVEGAELVMDRIPLRLSNPQIKVSKDWKVRSWVFRSALREYNSFVTVLRIGNVVMLGTPCDFSGEFNASIDSVASNLGMRAMVTSFNGGYIGYLTPQKYYDVDHYETRLMNWYAPGTGEYVSQYLKELIVAVSEAR